MKKLIALSLMILLVYTNVSGQNFQWASAIGGNGNEEGQSIITDYCGNIYVSGWFAGTVDFDPGNGVFNLTTNIKDYFIAKYSPSNVLIWAKAVPSNNINILYSSMTLDKSSNVIFTGTFRLTTDFDPGAGVFNLTTVSQSEVFVLKLNANGDFIWAKKFTSTSSPLSASSAIKCDASNNIIIGGRFYGSVDFDPGIGSVILTAVSSFYYDIFVCKLDANGNYIWVKSIGGTGHDNLASMDIDPSGTMYATGTFNGPVDFDPGAGVSTLASLGTSVFVWKLNSSGNFVDAKSFYAQSNCIVQSIKLDNAGNVLITGSFDGTFDFDPGANTASLTSAGGSDIYICKLNATLNYQWAKRFGNTSGDIGEAVQVDIYDNVYTTGRYVYQVDFDPGPNTFNLTPVATLDVFISVLDNAGNFVNALSYGGSSSDVAKAMHIDKLNNIYSTGFFSGTTDLNPGAASATKIANGSTDMYIQKLTQACVYPTGSISYLTNDSICSTDTAKLKMTPNQCINYQWYKGITLLAGKTSGTLDATSTGSYKCIGTNINGCTKQFGPKKVTVIPLPTSAIIANGPTTFCNGQSVMLDANIDSTLTYQWKRFSANIANAITPTYTATLAGTYKCITKNYFGCLRTSNSVVVTVNCREGEFNFADGTNIFPNPASENLTIQYEAIQGDATIEVKDVTGKLLITRHVYAEENSSDEIQIPISDLQNGIYFVGLTNGNKTQTFKINVVH